MCEEAFTGLGSIASGLKRFGGCSRQLQCNIAREISVIAHHLLLPPRDQSDAAADLDSARKVVSDPRIVSDYIKITLNDNMEASGPAQGAVQRASAPQSQG